MNVPVIDLATPTGLVFEWGWLLVTRANFVVYVLLVAVFVLGATVRLPGVKREIEAVERARVDGEEAGR
jgi:ABC-type transport system involved in cytochrome bd biosynthesis fused ATPase/permease subunit